MSRPILELGGVCKSFNDGSTVTRVLEDIGLCVGRGEFVMVTGPSGSGKSTLLHISALLEPPTEGMVRINGEPTAGVDEATLARLRTKTIGMVFQRYALLTRRSVMANVLMRFRYADVPRQEAERRSIAAIERVGLSRIGGRSAGVLSGGEMQRVAIARAIASGPDLLLADEPTGNLDAGTTRQVMALLGELNAGGLTIVMVTHNLGLLEYASRRVMIEDGRVVSAAGTTRGA